MLYDTDDILKDKEAIKAWLDKYRIKKYTIHEDFTVDVNGNVNLNDCNIKNIPVQFGVVNGTFECGYNKLTSLKGCPHTVNGEFHCSKNELINLIYGPKIVGKKYICVASGLTSLEGCPEKIYDSCDIHGNELITLKYGPVLVEGMFNCSYNKLQDLTHISKIIKGDIYCSNNPIINIESFDCQCSGFLKHSQSIIPSLEDYYITRYLNAPELDIKVSDLNKIILYNKMNDAVQNKLNTNAKKMKI